MVKVKDQYIHMAVGGWIPEAGKGDRKWLLQFLDEYDVIAPVMLRYAVEKFDKSEKEKYLSARKKWRRVRFEIFILWQLKIY